MTGKRALVTGGAVRVGRAIALALGDAGFTVAVHHFGSGAEAKETVKELGRGSFTVRADVGEPEEVERMFTVVEDRFDGKLDVLVSSAGIFQRVPAADLTPAMWQRMFAINVEGALWCAQAARPLLLAAGGGAIVNVTDISADRPWRGYAHYCASKAALVSLTKSLALEWAPEIRVNAVAPGAVLPPERTTKEEKKRLTEAIPAKRLGSPEDVARTVVFLADGPQYVTGQVIAVDGGRSISWR